MSDEFPSAVEVALRVWGRDREKAEPFVGRQPDAEEGRDGATVWWLRAEEADAAVLRIRSQPDLCIVTDIRGDHPRHVTVAVVTLRHDGRDYVIEEEFGYGYPPSSAEYMFREGNYSCDDNRSMMLHQRYPEVEEIDQCGDSIRLVDIRIERRATP